MSNYKDQLRDISTFIFDYDGVLTDGSVFVLPDGGAVRNGNVKDGYAIQLAIKNGYNIIILSGGRSESMYRRLEMLKVTDIYLGVTDKLAVFESFIKEKEINPLNILYMGDDIPDFKVMQKVKVACCPSDAASEIKAISHYISHMPGGKGCVRDIIEQVMRVQGKWMNQDAFHW